MNFNYGWICPTCARVYGPNTVSCTTCPVKPSSIVDYNMSPRTGSWRTTYSNGFATTTWSNGSGGSGGSGGFTR